MTTLITGAAGFIGFHLSKKLIEDGEFVIGLDNLNSYYDQSLKLARLKNLKNFSMRKNDNFIFKELDIENKDNLEKLFKDYKPNNVINMAAQAGVRYSLENPDAYIKSNLLGFTNLLECCRNSEIEHLVYASSSSVYGGNLNIPFSEENSVDHPVSLYAATKKANELIAHSYSHLFGIPSTGLRFFTVYGPWGRPDMALFIYTKAILENKSIKLFNEGNMQRDFTFIDDVIESTLRVLKKPPKFNNKFDRKVPNPSKSWTCHQIFNVGNSKPVFLKDFIKVIEDELGIKAKKEYLPMQKGDVEKTFANTTNLENWINYKPTKSLKEGIKEFINWYKDFYQYN